MKHSLLALLCLVSAVLGTLAPAAEPAKPYPFDPAVLQPFWRSSLMNGETVLFMKDNAAAAPKASLLFEPTKIVAVRSSAGDVTYENGRDYVWQPGTREITLPPGSRIVWKTPQDLRRPANSQRFRLTHRDGNGEILFGAGHEYHDMQTTVTYEHKPNVWQGIKPAFTGDQLPQTLAKLKTQKPLHIVLLGDSISTGCNASGWANAAPHQPPFQDLLVKNLEAVYGGKVTLTNLAVGGMATNWGVQQVDKVAAAKPDLVILAFGMNDACGLPVERYQQNTRAMIDGIRQKSPHAEFILIASMLGNKDWTIMRPQMFGPYRDALAQLCGPGIALADMTGVWTELLKHKKDWDMTGNGVNHPNDFGHRVYAQVLSALLIPETKQE